MIYYKMSYRAKGSGDSTMILIFMMIMMVICFISSVLVCGTWFLFFASQEGDSCKGDDKNAEFEIDEDGECTFVTCDSGYRVESATRMCVLDTGDYEEYGGSGYGSGEGEGEGEGEGGGGGAAVRYVKLLHTRDNIHINLQKIEVYESGGTVDVALNKTVTASSGGGSPYELENFVDGTTSVGSTGVVRHYEAARKEHVMVDLGSSFNVEKVVLTNRGDHCCDDRIVGVKVQALSESQAILAESPPISTTNSTYTITFGTSGTTVSGQGAPSTAPAPAPAPAPSPAPAPAPSPSGGGGGSCQRTSRWNERDCRDCAQFGQNMCGGGSGCCEWRSSSGGSSPSSAATS